MTVSSWSGGIANGVACIPLTIAVRGNPQSNGHKIVRYVTSWIGAVTTSTKRCPQAHRQGARYSTEFGQHSTYCGRFGTFVPIVEMMSQQLRRPSISPAAGVEDPGLAYRPVGVNPWSGAECITAPGRACIQPHCGVAGGLGEFTPVTSATPQWSPPPASGPSSISDPRLLMDS